jgi:cation diffusion facilitator CzcD-associated flavoprotein CzcO
VTTGERRLYRRLPAAQRLVRGFTYWSRELLVSAFRHRPLRALPEYVSRRHLARQVPDPHLRARLTPDYGLGCKRVLLSDAYYPALQEPNVTLVTDPIEAIDAHTVLTAQGASGNGQAQAHQLDAIILATGFHVTDVPMAAWVRGADGRTLAEVWGGSPQAYLGAMVTGFPNLFVLYGPNTNLGHSSVLFMVESQLNLLIDCLRELARRGAATFDVLPSVQARYNDWLQRSLGGTVWNSGGCRSWYLDANGRNSSIWPASTWAFHRRTRHFVPSEYVLAPRGAPAGGLGEAGAPAETTARAGSL